MLLRLLFTIAVPFFFAGCNKDVLPEGNCEALKEAIAADNKEQVQGQINAFIQSLPSSINTEENLNGLTRTFSGCDITATVLCFGCIDTLPEQSEIRLSFFSSGSEISRTIDVSYTAENKMIFSGMHE